MIIDHFSTFPHGGAGTAARRLHQRLARLGLRSRFNYWKDEAGQRLDNSYHRLEFSPPPRPLVARPLVEKWRRRRKRRICRLYDRHLAQRPPDFELFSMPWTLDPTRFDFASMGSDIVHLHWMAFFIDYPAFFASIPLEIPIVWSLHDMNPLTGGCHYSSGCSRFTVGCGNCPQVSQPGPRDVSQRGFRSKQLALKDRELHIVTPNQWLGDLARHSRLLPPETQFHLIRLGLDTRRFRPHDQREARRRLGLPNDDRVLVAFGAEDIENYRKGFHHLLGALKRLGHRTDVECLVFGSGKLPADRNGLPRFHEFGFIDSEQRQALLYSAADLFVLPSREDNQPQTGLESMACGRPVVAFRAGGIPEYVVQGRTGLLAGLGDEAEMAQLIGWLADHAEARRQMGAYARALIEERFTEQHQALQYLALYQQIARGQNALPAPMPRAA